MNTYVLLLRGEAIDFGSYSPEEMQKLMTDFDAWNAKMIDAEQLVVSAGLEGGGGKTLRQGIISDGPYSEAKEAVVGLLLIQAANEEQALAAAAGCPFLTRGGSVEMRLVPQLDFEDAALAIVKAHAQARMQSKES